MAWGHEERSGEGDSKSWGNSRTKRSKKAIKLTNYAWWFLNSLVRDYIHLEPRTNQKWTGQCWQRYKLLWFLLFRTLSPTHTPQCLCWELCTSTLWNKNLPMWVFACPWVPFFSFAVRAQIHISVPFVSCLWHRQ